MFLNNTHTLLATLAVSNSSFEQHSHTFGRFCFKKLGQRSWAQSWLQNAPLGAPLGDLGHHLCPKMVPLGLLLAILGTILSQEWFPWGSSWRSWAQSWAKIVPLGSSWRSWAPSWPKMVPLGVLLVILGTILRGILYIHKLPINRKAADTCNYNTLI